MADYDFRYSLERAPEPTLDGSSCALHDIQVVARIAGTSDPFTPVGGRHKQIAIPAADLAQVLAMPNGAAKVNAYKDLLAINLDTQPVPIQGWSLEDLESFMDANDMAISVAIAANDYITVTLHLVYPIRFSY